ncbi:MAG: hypothetical protein ACE3JK_13565 [Sporolactobacillus sp.]
MNIIRCFFIYRSLWLRFSSLLGDSYLLASKNALDRKGTDLLPTIAIGSHVRFPD